MDEKITAIITNRRYVRYSTRYDKWYRAIIAENPRIGTVRVSRSKFKTAWDAERFHFRFRMRLERLKRAAEVVDPIPA